MADCEYTDNCWIRFDWYHIVLAGGGMLMAVGIICLLWRYCSNDESPKLRRPFSNTPVPADSSVVAHEVDPGLVVLQTQDGNFFRVFRECRSQQQVTGRGTSNTRLEGELIQMRETPASRDFSGWRPISEVEDAIHYGPVITSLEYQNVGPIPSAPQASRGDETQHLVSYDYNTSQARGLAGYGTSH